MGDASQASVSAPTLQNVRRVVAARMTFRDRVCFASVKTLALDAGCSERTIQRSLRQLVKDGTLECLGYLLPSGRKVRALVYRFKAGVKRIVTQRSLSRNPRTATGSREVCSRRNVIGACRPKWRRIVTLARREPLPGFPVQPPSTPQLIADFIDSARLRGAVVPHRVVGHLARNVKELLDEGVSVEAVQAGLERLLERRIVQPQLLPYLVMEASLPAPETKRFGRGMTPAQILRFGKGLQ